MPTRDIVLTVPTHHQAFARSKQHEKIEKTLYSTPKQRLTLSTPIVAKTHPRREGSQDFLEHLHASVGAVKQILARWHNEQRGSITCSKLQKLVYYAYGWHLVLEGGCRLFEENAFAGEHGPTFKAIDDRYRLKGGVVFAFDTRNPVAILHSHILDAVVHTYGALSESILNARTYQETPWQKNYDETRLAAIPVDEIRAFFLDLREHAKRQTDMDFLNDYLDRRYGAIKKNTVSSGTQLSEEELDQVLETHS